MVRILLFLIFLFDSLSILRIDCILFRNQALLGFSRMATAGIESAQFNVGHLLTKTKICYPWIQSNTINNSTQNPLSLITYVNSSEINSNTKSVEQISIGISLLDLSVWNNNKLSAIKNNNFTTLVAISPPIIHLTNDSSIIPTADCELR